MDSFEHVGESFCRVDVSSSKPLATRRALTVDCPLFTAFSVITHLTDIVLCPSLGTLTNTSLSLQDLISASLAAVTVASEYRIIDSFPSGRGDKSLRVFKTYQPVQPVLSNITL
ncbi:unnamed protein product [Meganyctiphanes norvegica]|uniref:Uncharacterized protein n=1 Tax=Meganyctiphanes norvegica TaxID=48144 RepID=A0AAV2SJB8_MEGNR